MPRSMYIACAERQQIFSKTQILSLRLTKLTWQNILSVKNGITKSVPLYTTSGFKAKHSKRKCMHCKKQSLI